MSGGDLKGGRKLRKPKVTGRGEPVAQHLSVPTFAALLEAGKASPACRLVNPASGGGARASRGGGARQAAAGGRPRRPGGGADVGGGFGRLA